MTFLNPLLLLGALGLALPILAHLINRQQVQRTDWAAMRFLDRNVRVRSRQVRLRDVLLLVLRCLAVLMIVFALARPATSGAGWGWVPGEPRAGVVIAIDGSYSMGHETGGASRFDRALEHARFIADRIEPGDPVTLVLLAGEPRVVLRNAAFDPGRFDAALSGLRPSPEPLDTAEVPKQLDALVADMDAPQKEVYLISDTQARGWGEASAPFDDSLKALTGRASVFVVPVAGEGENLAVTDLQWVSGSLRKGGVARYQATVHNFGRSPATGVEVRCRAQGVEIDRNRIDLIAPGASETVSLSVPFYNAGPTRITAEIAGDALATDNVRRAVAVVRDRVSVLCVDGSTGEAGRLIRSALLARGGGGEDEDYLVRSVRWPAMPADGLDDVDVLILADVPEITPGQAEQIDRFVRRGNGLVWFAGDNVKASRWNRHAAGDDALLPARLGPAIDASDALGVGTPLAPALPDHAVCRPLRSLPEDLINETRFLKRLDVEPGRASFAVLNLAGTGQPPILLERALGRGHVFMFTTSADTAWNNLALTPAFPMLMQQIVTHLVGRAFEPPRIVGDALSLSYVEQPDASDAVFDTPADETIAVPVREHRGAFVAMLERSREAGFYEARVSVQAPGTPIAVNVDTRESAVACLSSAELDQRLRGSGVTISPTQADLAADIATARTGRSSWRYFLLAGLILLLAESLFADRLFKRKSARRQTPAAPTTPVEVA
ncbi:MAG: BatA domain-containing protein [Phycisphaeraceae bacterium]